MVNLLVILLGALMVPVLLFLGALLVMADIWRRTDEGQE